jgi:branched-chain amino acid transport system substrate-binding protein
MILRLVAALLSVLVIAATGRSDPTGNPIKIGVVYGFTGAAAVWSDYGRKALELARDEINSEGGIHGFPLELIFEDSRTSPMGALSAYRKLVDVDKVPVVLGDVWSFITNPLIPSSARDKVVLISPTVMDVSVEGKSDSFFTFGHRVDGIRRAVGKFLARNPRSKTAAILCWDDNWGRAHLTLWKEILSQNHISLVDESCQGDFIYDYKADITRIAAKKPDLLIFGFGVETISRRLAEQNFHPSILTTNDMVEAVVEKKLPAPLLEGMYFTDWPQGPNFRAAFKKRFGKEPAIEAQNHFEVLQALARALRNDPGNLLVGLKKLNYHGEVDPIDFSKAPSVNLGVAELYQVRSGEIHQIE